MTRSPHLPGATPMTILGSLSEPDPFPATQPRVHKFRFRRNPDGTMTGMILPA